MNKYFISILLPISILLNAQIDVKILKIQEPKSHITICISNNTDKRIIIYDNFLYSHYNIYEAINNRIIAPYGYTNANLIYTDYQYNFNKDLIKKTQNQYNLSYENTIYFLENKKTSIIIDPNSQRNIILKVFYPPVHPSSIIEKGLYYLVGKIVFTTDYFPKEYIDSLQKQGFTILNEIEIPKIEIDINNFFLKDVKKVPIPEISGLHF